MRLLNQGRYSSSVGVYVLLVFAIISVFAYVIAPDKSANAATMRLSIASKPMGFRVKILSLPSRPSSQNMVSKFFTGVEAGHVEIPISSYRFSGNVLYIKEYKGDSTPEQLEKKIPLHIFPKTLSTKQIAEKYISNRGFLLGTDNYGRDFLSRMLIGTRVSFYVGIIAVFISLVIGIPAGAISGYYGGRVDAFVMWIINVTWSIPTLLMVIAITLFLGKGFWQVFVAVGLTMWVEVARIVRGQMISEKQALYVTAARALGYSDFRIIVRHICPNIMAPVIVISSANFSSAILIESGLSFLGIGAQPPTPSWGGIIKAHYNHIITGEPHLAIIPGLAIMALVTSSMILSNTLRDRLDTKSMS